MIFVAEIGSAHKGIKSLAFEMIRQSALAGADIAKFQLGWPPPKRVYPNKNILDAKRDEIRHAPMGWVEDLDKWCTHFGIEFMASIWSMEGLETARSVGMKRYKMAHQMSEPSELITEVIYDGKETFISTDVPWEEPLVRNIFTVSAYPTYPSMLHMPERFGEYYGYSSHMHGYADALIAIARGAQYIEKHVTLDKTEDSIRDNHFALSFGEFRQMVDIGREMARLI